MTTLSSKTTTALWFILVVVITAIISSSLPPTGHGLSPLRNATIGCLAHERIALLKFKEGITSDPTGLLSSWRQSDQDCCRWRGVRCSKRTGHVVGLHLRHVPAGGDGPYSGNDAILTGMVGQISPSLLSLQRLRHLDLSLNNLQGPTSQFPEFLGDLKNLRYLNLSAIPFNGRIPPQLGNLTKLHYLDLSVNTYYYTNLYSTDLSWLTRLPSLQYLNMQSTNLSIALDWAHAVSMAPSLKVLDLSDCHLASANQSLPHLNLTHIERLDLSENDFNHPVASCWFWNLTSLTYLGIGGTHLYGKFHHALGGMASLQVLDFSDSSDGGLDIMTANMTNLCNIQFLSFSFSYVNGDITEFFENLPQCSQKLKELHLDNNDFTGVIPNWIGRWASLVILDISNNQINGSVPSEIGMLTSLLTLDLSNNQINGFPSEIGRLTSLLTLDLSNNQINGLVPSEIGTLTSLLTLDLSNNQITALPPEIRMLNNLTSLNLHSNNLSVITQEILSGLTSLITIDLSSNSLKIAVDANWLPPFSLQYAYFASCDMGPQFPTWLQSQTQIVYLDLSSARIFGNLPGWFASTFSNASWMNISDNGISGTLPTNMEAMESLTKLYFHSNHLTGPIPKLPQNLGVLDISRNFLSGPLPSNFGAPGMYDLRLFSNRIAGHVPQYICQWESIGVLDLADNFLEGEFPECFPPQSFFNGMLFLSNNRFSGKFPPGLQRLTNLYILDLAWNNFSGGLPMWIGNLPNLEILRLGHNNFSGNIPATITNLTQLLHLDLSANGISGFLPQNLSKLTGMTTRGSPTTFGNYVPVLNLSVTTKGDKRYYEESQIFQVVVIDLSANFLTGGIPEEITSLDAVVSLNFSHNRLSGKIPSNIGIMQALESLDLSENKLYGELPQSLSNLSYLSYLDLSYNNFSGRIPSGGQLDTLYSQNPFMYDGNRGLCGDPLHKNCSEGPKHGDPKRDHHDSMLMSFPFGVGIGLVVGHWVVFCVILFKKTWRIAYFRHFDNAYDKVYVFVVVKWASLAQNTAWLGLARKATADSASFMTLGDIVCHCTQYISK